ncbi:unnamed protein product [Rotaria sordida]|uniref:EGF-like domain-containing protein n=1 Tax=Rotaria sordida TaxID=392033 RepID=A0A814CZP6_9BILA|nr:unnamed protein product [Rotaria sordida]
MIFVFLIFYMNIVLCTSNNTTQFDNFTIEWQDFNLFNCAVPTIMNLSLFTCLPPAGYTQVDDINCLNMTSVDFDQNMCQITTDTVIYTTSTLIVTQETTTLTSTYKQAETSISMTTATTQSTTTTTTTDVASTYTSITTITDAIHTSTTSSATIHSSSSSSTTTTTTTTTITTTTTPNENIYSCPNNSYIGSYCNISSDACTVSQPCENAATCFPNNSVPYGYYCHCQTGYEGYNCQYDNRACMETTCWHNGTCISVNSTISSTDGTNFKCECMEGYNGVYCELTVDLCGNITCENNGICQTVELMWQCLCLDTTFYYGDYCQFKTSTLKIKEMLSKSFASIAIGAIVTTCTFVIVMDVLKYVFHIDPVEYERDNYRKRREAQKRARRPVKKNQLNVALRFQYVS